MRQRIRRLPKKPDPVASDPAETMLGGVFFESGFADYTRKKDEKTLMNTQKLTALLETVRCGSISKAAEQLGYTQSGLAYAINSFESELGLPVIIRDQSGIRLSPEGEALLPWFEKLLADDAALAAQVSRMLHSGDNVLNIASYPDFADTVLPRLLVDFHAAMPEAEVNIRIGDREDMVRWLKSGEVDLAFGGELQLSLFRWTPLLCDPELAVLPEDYPTEGMERFPMEEFKKHPFIMAEYWEDEKELRQAIEDCGITPQFSLQGPDNGAVLAMVEKGVALAILPEITLKACVGKVKTLPLDPPCCRVLGLICRSAGENNTAAHRFLKCLKDWAKRQGQSEPSLL